MRTFATLLFAILITIIASAQTPGDTLTMYFDDASDSLHLDSIYPAGCWQVGHPNKPVFTSAYSEPNALVTDTVLPHQDSTTCYAEFSLVSIDNTRHRDVWFRHWSDTDSLDSYGWLEVFDPLVDQWVSLWEVQDFCATLDYGFQTWTDSGAVFTGRSNGWVLAKLVVDCCKSGPVPQHLRLRFGFYGGANPSHRDGWIIDNVRATAGGCSGGIEEHQQISLNTFPNPANTSTTLDLGLPQGERYTLELVRADGALVLREHRRNTGTQALDLSRFGDGPYLLRVITDTRQASERIIVEH